MRRAIRLGLLIAAIAPAVPASAADIECDSGLKRHLARITIYVDRVPGAELATALDQSMKVYDACKAGDDFSPTGKWTEIALRLKRLAPQ